QAERTAGVHVDSVVLSVTAGRTASELFAATVHLKQPIVSDADIERSEEHTSELQSLRQLVCRLLLEKKNSTPQMRTPCASRPSGRRAPGSATGTSCPAATPGPPETTTSAPGRPTWTRHTRTRSASRS